MKVFYGMYYEAMQNFFAGKASNVPRLWFTHFSGPPSDNDSSVEPTSMEAVQFSVQTGATAHIQHDMPIALATAYQTWSVSPKPAFQELKADFIEKSEGAFARVLALMRERIFLNVGRGQFAICQVPQFESQIFQVIFRHWLSKEFLNDREEVSQGANGRQGRSVTGPGETTERSEKKRRLNQRQGDAAVLQAASLRVILKTCR
jgi:hypothetical protein